MPAKRIIACLDVRDGRVVKGVRFEGHVDMGDPADLAVRYRDAGVDELVIYDITASAERRTIDYGWVSEIARHLDIPLCVAGGIRSIEQAVSCLESGADKVSINSPALADPEFITQLSNVAGSQCVVVGVDSRLVEGEWSAFQFTGDAKTIRRTPRRMLDWIVEAAERGAGEIVLNCMDSDGVRNGFDIAQLKEARARLSVPLVASGGAGTAADFVRVFKEADVSGALAAGVFHSGATSVSDVKAALRRAGLEART